MNAGVLPSERGEPGRPLAANPCHPALVGWSGPRLTSGGGRSARAVKQPCGQVTQENGAANDTPHHLTTP
jgi:hypothetical protein